jgi:hypothetical protein
MIDFWACFLLKLLVNLVCYRVFMDDFGDITAFLKNFSPPGIQPQRQLRIQINPMP